MIKILNKKKFIFLILFVIGIISIVMLLVFSFVRNNRYSDGEKFKIEYEKYNNKKSSDNREYPYITIPSDNIIRYISISEIINIFEKDMDAVIYFGKPECIYCRNAVQVLVDTVKSTDLDVVYYLEPNIKDKKYDELVKILGDELIIKKDKKEIIVEPLVIFITDGEIVSYNKETLSSQKDPYRKLDQYQYDALREIYNYGINDVVSSKKIKNLI